MRSQAPAAGAKGHVSLAPARSARRAFAEQRGEIGQRRQVGELVVVDDRPDAPHRTVLDVDREDVDEPAGGVEAPSTRLAVDRSGFEHDLAGLELTLESDEQPADQIGRASCRESGWVTVVERVLEE